MSILLLNYHACDPHFGLAKFGIIRNTVEEYEEESVATLSSPSAELDTTRRNS